SLDFALSRARGGEIITLKPGIYRGPVQIPASAAGSAKAPTMIRAEQKWKSTILGSPVHCLNIDKGCQWIIIDGIEVSGAKYTGIKVGAAHITIRNCWIHHNALQGVEVSGASDFTFEFNIVEYNGSNPQWDHGVYASGTRHYYRSNIIRHNASCGL